MALRRPESATVQWVFISKEPLNGKFEYHSQGSKEITVPLTGSVKVAAISEPMTEEHYLETSSLFHITSANIPAGWVVTILQGGRIIKQLGSTPEMIGWVTKNPPPKE
jgi:hypothetical protein